MAMDPHIFCRTIPGIHVAHCGGHQSYLNEDSYCPENNPGAETDLRKIWTARANNIRQLTDLNSSHTNSSCLPNQMASSTTEWHHIIHALMEQPRDLYKHLKWQ